MQTQSKISWKSPSNIALVKYWGKFGRQYPSNPSISLTLNNAHTITELEYEYSDSKLDSIELEFMFEGKANKAFEDKLKKFLNSIEDVYPLINHLRLKINSSNSFPHSSGIASSASSMSALAMCLVDIERNINGTEALDMYKASNLARLGSGSASRSVFPKIAVWGSAESIANSSNDHAIPYVEGIDPVFYTYRDDILLVSKKEKSVSSRAGHALMENNPYAEIRFAEANKNLDAIIRCMKEGDLHGFGELVEKEALSLHALMMCSNPPYLLIEADTVHIIKAIQQFRMDTNIPVYFTLDAGPNIHMLYPSEFAEPIKDLKAVLTDYCQDGSILDDEVGNGPEKLM